MWLTYCVLHFHKLQQVRQFAACPVFAIVVIVLVVQWF